MAEAKTYYKVMAVNSHVVTKISKSKFVAGGQCLKRLYWQVHEAELAAEPAPPLKPSWSRGEKTGYLPASSPWRGGQRRWRVTRQQGR